MKILLVCLGNICRSPLAEGILQYKVQQAKLDWVIESAGTNGYHTGEAPHHLSQKIAKKNGIDISKQVSRRFIKDDLQQYDLILAMAADVMDDIRNICSNAVDEQKVRLFLNEVYPGENRDVPDPWYGGEDGYIEVYEIIEQACEEIIKKYSA